MLGGVKVSNYVCFERIRPKQKWKDLFKKPLT